MRDVLKVVDIITWDVQIGDLLDLKSWCGTDAMRRWEVVRWAKRKKNVWR